jgi:hypothetical protein
MGKSQKKRLLEAHVRTARQYKLFCYTQGDKQMLHIESR